jgi:protocatechuate 3,4-dioxygenase beta subunit
VKRTFRIAVTAGGMTGLLAAGVLAAPTVTANAGQITAPSPAVHLPISARQMLADQQLHKRAASATGSITGSAQSADGQPLASVCVSTYGPSGRSFAATRPDGRFLISGLKPGRYQVRYAGCGSTAQYLPEWYGGAAQRSASQSVVVRGAALRPLAPTTMQTLASTSVTADVINPSSQATIVQSARTALGMPAYGNGTRLAAPALAASANGHIAGVVTDPSGHGLKGICVVAFSFSSFGSSSAVTTKTGHYRTGRLPAGRYVVLFLADCGNKGNWEAQVYKDAPFTKPTLVRVRSGKTTPGIDAKLKLGGEISGIVTNQSGSKLSAICAQPVGSRKNVAAFFVSGISVRGTYHLRGLPTGSYKLVFVPCRPSAYAEIWWPHAQSERAAKSIRLKARQIRSHINAVMPIGGVISGTVTNASKAPLKGICVNAFTGSADGEFISVGLVQNLATNAAGHYTIRGLSPGAYHVQFTLGCGNNGNYLSANYPSLVRVTYGQTRAGINVQLPTGATLSGTVTSASTSNAVRGICVEVSGGPNTNFYDQNKATSAAGTYKVDQLSPGTYFAQFSGGCGNSGSYAPQGYDNTNVFLPQPIKVTAAGQVITGIDAAMQPGATITGTVKGPGGQKLSGICVFAFNPASGLGDQANSAAGHYSLPNLLPAQYQVSFSPGCNNNADLTSASFGSQLNPPSVSAPAGTTSGIDGVLAAAGNISGKILTRSGKALQLGCVAVTGLTRATEAFSGLGNMSQSAGGKYEITNLLPGPYQVYFQPTCFSNSGYENQWFKDKPSPAGAVRVHVRAGHTITGITSALVKGGSIAGTVTSAGKPIRNACVFAQNITQFLDFGTATTNKAGKYAVPGLNPGKYELEFYPCGEGSTTLAERVLARLVTVTAPHRTSGVNTSLALGGKITGTVLGGSPAVAQPGLCVIAFQVHGDGANLGFTNANGAFSITNLPAGKYVVDIGDIGCSDIVSNLAPQWYLDAPTSAHATVVSVASGKATTLTTVTLSTNGAIAGTVTGPGNAAVAGICVTATSSLSPVPVVAVSRAGGAYSLIGLPPTKYRVEFSSGCGASGYQTQWYNGKKSAGTATLVPVTADSTTTGIDASLQK